MRRRRARASTQRTTTASVASRTTR
uniref:Uncharacterized protein n=1 Tax=Arundo donax TaxID=35708 RepID=A0A0A9C357_ARUDO